MDIGTQKQLFIDDYIIESMKGVYRILNQPVKYKSNPVIELEPPQKVRGNELIIASGSVIYDEEEHLFKMWYEGANYKWSHNVVAYAYSEDGIYWNLPNLGLVEYNGSRNNNIVFHRGKGEMSPGVFKDPVAKDPQRKYKMIYNRGDGVGTAFSPDGIHWTVWSDKAVIKVSDSPNSVRWEPELRKYVAHTRHNQVCHKEGNTVRQVMQSESDDFLTWQSIGVIMKPDEKDPPWNRQFYNMEWMPYEGMYLGFLCVYHILPGMEPKITPGAPWMDKTDIQLTFSRDGRIWHRAGDREVFLPTSPQAGECDSGMVYVMQHPIVVSDEIWIYYIGFQSLHWATLRHELQGGVVCLAKLRIDGFISLDAGEGVLTTKLLRMSGDQLNVNVDASLGSLSTEILDPGGKPIKGFSRDDADPVTGDSRQHTVTWNGSADLSNLKGKPIILRFYLSRCKLYSFTFPAAGV